MSGGYTPLFGSMLEGTLYGRWPHTGIWACLLSLVDQHGTINKNPQLIANAVGVPLEQLLACINDFMSPDPGSQSQEKEGRRLELIDTNRDWGWRVINSGKYREKARLMGKAKREVEEGRNAARLRDRRRPPKTAAKRLSDSYTDLNKNTDTDKTQEPSPEAPAGLDGVAWQKWVEYRKERKPAIKAMSVLAAMREMAALGDGQMAAVEHSIANGWQGLIAPKANGSAGWRDKPTRKPKTVAELEAEEASRAQH
jgi:hypothetical protein